mmetsp:Transcript_42289/g.106668  ORF Transcript_42289/g.106668 Transcript_42289/m.106668 type:complete len:202 (+) Transcript_42289:153-758(+)
MHFRLEFNAESTIPRPPLPLATCSLLPEVAILEHLFGKGWIARCFGDGTGELVSLHIEVVAREEHVVHCNTWQHKAIGKQCTDRHQEENVLVIVYLSKVVMIHGATSELEHLPTDCLSLHECVHYRSGPLRMNLQLDLYRSSCSPHTISRTVREQQEVPEDVLEAIEIVSILKEDHLTCAGLEAQLSSSTRSTTRFHTNCL